MSAEPRSSHVPGPGSVPGSGGPVTWNVPTRTAELTEGTAIKLTTPTPTSPALAVNEARVSPIVDHPVKPPVSNPLLPTESANVADEDKHIRNVRMQTRSTVLMEALQFLKLKSFTRSIS